MGMILCLPLLHQIQNHNLQLVYSSDWGLSASRSAGMHFFFPVIKLILRIHPGWMGKLLLITGLVFTIFFGSFSDAQDQDARILTNLLANCDTLVNNGDFINGEKTIMLYLQHPLTEYQKGMGYTRLAGIYINLGRYNDALTWLRKIETLRLKKYEQDYILN